MAARKWSNEEEAKVTGNEEIIEIVWEWFTNARSKSSHMSVVQSDVQFKASTGWLYSFMKRHNIVRNGGCGDVDEIVGSINQNG
jgi:hypothetical protein